jgi:hypothetical protein
VPHASALFCAAIAPELAAQTPSNPIQLPASGRVLQCGSVSTTHSTVNAGGQNSVNLIDSSVNIQGTYQGSVPTGSDSRSSSQLLPDVNGSLRETVEETDLTAMGFQPSLFLYF